MTQSTHTPTPIEVEESNYGEELWFGGKGMGLITIHIGEFGWREGGCKNVPDQWERLKQQAALIVKAVNCHAELVSVIKHLQDNYSRGRDEDADWTNETQARVNAILAKAGEL